MSLLFAESPEEVAGHVRYTIAPMTFASVRSPRWAQKRQEWVSEHPKCECCGRRTNLNVHHIKPFHLFPALELQDDNLITLCEGGPINCHYLAGHAGMGWSQYSRNVNEQIRAVSSLIRVLKRGAD